MSRVAKAATIAAAVGAVGAIAYGVPAIASAAGSSPSPAPHTSPAGPDSRHMTAEQELTGSTAASVKAAVLAKVPGATVERMSAEDTAEKPGVAYEAHVRKSDGTQAQVLLDKNFKVLSVTSGFGGGHFGRGHFGRGFGGGPGFAGGHGGKETELTGTTASRVSAAVTATIPGATVDRMSKEDASQSTGAAYEAHATKSDGTHVEVLLDKTFKVISTRTAPAVRDHFGGPSAGGDGSNGTSGTPSSNDGGWGAADGAAGYSAVNA